MTGASDAGLQFARYGWPVEVHLCPDAKKAEKGEDRALITVLSTDTRELHPTEAVKLLADWLKVWPVDTRDTVFKKIDSTLRGNIGAEIEFLLSTKLFAGAVVIPAYPAIGRKTVGGQHSVYDVPLHKTEFAGGVALQGTSNLIEIIAHRMTYPVRQIGLECIRGGGAAEAFRAARTNSLPVLCCDAEREEDIASAVRQLRALNEPLLWVGSAGLAAALGETLGQPTDIQRSAAPQPSASRIVVIAGSMSGVTRRQVSELERARECTVWQLEPHELISPDSLTLPPITQQEEGILVLTTTANRAGDPHQVAKGLSRLTARAFRAWQADGLVLTGGGTAVQVCLELGIEKLLVQAQVEEGIPLCVVPELGLPVVTKAGGFGSDRALVKAVDCLRQKHDEERVSCEGA